MRTRQVPEVEVVYREILTALLMMLGGYRMTMMVRRSSLPDASDRRRRAEALAAERRELARVQRQRDEVREMVTLGLTAYTRRRERAVEQMVVECHLEPWREGVHL
jgi:hypothetical protein